MADIDTQQIAADVNEKTLEWSDIEGLTVFDREGTTVPFGDLYASRKSIIIFVREANVRLIVVGCAKHTFIKNFCKVTGYDHEMYSDPTATVYSKLGMIRTLANGAASSEHVKSSVVSGLANSLWRSVKSMSSQGDMKQQGGQLILGPGNVMKYLHIDGGTFDHTPINKLLTMADVATVDFSKK